MNTTPTDLAAQARKHADKISAGITMGHDWPNTQDELDRLNAAECLRQCAQELERKVAELRDQSGRVHELKTDSPVFDDVVAGRKLFEIRRDDRGFACGDLLRLRETRFNGAEMAAGEPLIYTGQEQTVRVISILRGPVYGLAEGWVIMSIATPPASAQPDQSEDMLDMVARKDAYCFQNEAAAMEWLGSGNREQMRPVYTSPPPAAGREPLTDEQIDSAWRSACERHELTRDIVRDFARRITARSSGAKGSA